MATMRQRNLAAAAAQRPGTEKNVLLPGICCSLLLCSSVRQSASTCLASLADILLYDWSHVYNTSARWQTRTGRTHGFHSCCRHYVVQQYATRSSATAKSTARPSCLVGVLYKICLEKICWWLINHFYVIGPKSYRIRRYNATYTVYAIQGHSSSPILVPIESPYATSY